MLDRDKLVELLAIFAGTVFVAFILILFLLKFLR